MIKLFTIRHGSWLYGTNTSQSDIDLKTIYLPDLGNLLIGRQPDTFKNRPGHEEDKMLPGDTEEEFIPLQVFAQHFLQNQSYALELTFAFLQNKNVEFVNYEYSFRLHAFFVGLLTFKNRNVDSIIGYAYSQSLKYGLKGERLQAIRDLKEKVNQVRVDIRGNNTNKTIADVAYQWFKPYDPADKQPIFITTIEPTRSNLEVVEALSIGNKLYAFNTTLKHFSKALDGLEEKYGARTEKALDGHDWKAISHSIRITAQGVEYLLTGKLEFPHGLAPYLLEVKNGNVSEENAYARLEELFANLKAAKSETELPELNETMSLEFQEWLKGSMLNFYSIKE